MYNHFSFRIRELFKQTSICIDMFNSIQRKKEHISLCIWLTYSDLVFILYFLSCNLIWAPQRARTSSDLLVLQMEPFCCTCWLTFHPKLTEHFSLWTNVPEHIMEWSVSSRQFWTKLKVVCSWIYWFPFVFASTSNLPYASLLWSSKGSSCCYWQDYWELNIKHCRKIDIFCWIYSCTTSRCWYLLGHVSHQISTGWKRKVTANVGNCYMWAYTFSWKSCL